MSANGPESSTLNAYKRVEFFKLARGWRQLNIEFRVTAMLFYDSGYGSIIRPMAG